MLLFSKKKCLLWLLSFLIGSCVVVNSDQKNPGNVNHLEYGFNILLGKTAHEQARNLENGRIHDLTRNTNGAGHEGEEYFWYDQFAGLSGSKDCQVVSTSDSAEYSTSSSSLARQASTYNAGFDQTIDIGTSVEVTAGAFGVGVTAGLTTDTTIRNAMIYGNSRTSLSQRSHANGGKTFTFDASSRRSDYTVELDLDKLQWDEDFVDDIDAVNPNDISSILSFFKDYGTHLIHKAEFGQVCTTSVFMEEGYTTEEYDEMLDIIDEDEKAFFWYTESSSSQDTSSRSGTSDSGFSYEFSNRYCYGELDYDTSCQGGGMVNSGVSSPSITKWQHIAFWEIDSIPMSAELKNEMKKVFDGIYSAGIQCAYVDCSGGRGTCIPNYSLWHNGELSQITSSDDFDQFWIAPNDGGRCICAANYLDSSCSTYGEVLPSRWLLKSSDYPNFGSTWSQQKYYSTIQTVGFKGKLFVIARGSGYFLTYAYDGTSWVHLNTNEKFPDGNVLFPAVAGNVLYLLARASDGMRTYKWNEVSSYWELLASGSSVFSDSNLWNEHKYYSTIQTVVLNDELHLLARGAGGLELFRFDSSNNNYINLLSAPCDRLSDAYGWDQYKYYSTIQSSVIDGKLYVTARGVSGMYVYLYNGVDSFTDLLSGVGLHTDAGGWGEHMYFSTIESVVIRGSLYLSARGAAGMFLHKYNVNTNSWSLITSGGPFPDDGEGWNDITNYDTIQVHVFRDQLYLIARGDGRVFTYRFDFDSGVYVEATDSSSSPHWTDSAGWNNEAFYSTIEAQVVNDDMYLVGRAPTGNYQLYRFA